MVRRQRSSATSFLAELIIVVFFLITSAAIISQVLAAAETQRMQANDLNAATLRAQSLLESVLATSDEDMRAYNNFGDYVTYVAEITRRNYGTAVLHSDLSLTAAIVCFFDDNWQVSDDEYSPQRVELTISPYSEDNNALIAQDYLAYTFEVATYRGDAKILQFTTLRAVPEHRFVLADVSADPHQTTVFGPITVAIGGD